MYLTSKRWGEETLAMLLLSGILAGVLKAGVVVHILTSDVRNTVPVVIHRAPFLLTHVPFLIFFVTCLKLTHCVFLHVCVLLMLLSDCQLTPGHAVHVVWWQPFLSL